MTSFEDILRESARKTKEKEQEYEALKDKRNAELKSLVTNSKHVFDRRKSRYLNKKEGILADRHSEIVKMYDNGYSQSRIAQKLGYAINTVAEYMRENGMGKFK